MKYKFYVKIIFLYFLVSGSYTLANENVLVLANKGTDFQMEKYTSYFLDPTQFMTFQDIFQISNTEKFKPLETRQINFLYTKDVVWLKLNVKSNEKNANWCLKIGNPLLENMAVYILKEGQPRAKRFNLGFLSYGNQWTNPLEFLPLGLEYDKEYTILVQLSGKNIIIPELSIGDEESFQWERFRYIFYQGAFWGVVVLFFLLSFTQAIFRKSALMFSFSMYILCTALLYFFLNGWGIYSGNHLLVKCANEWVLFSLVLQNAALVYFIQSFHKGYIPSAFWGKNLWKYIWISLGVFYALTWLVDYSFLLYLSYSLCFFVPIGFLIYTSWIAFKNDYTPAIYLLVGGVSVCLVFMYFGAGLYGIVDQTIFTRLMNQYFQCIQIVLFAFGIYQKDLFETHQPKSSQIEIIKKARENQVLQNELTKQQKTLYQSVIQAQEKERARLSKDLHDGVGQSLAAIRMVFGECVDKVGESENKAKIIQNLALLDEVCQELRGISHQMMPHNLIKFGLRTGVEELVHHAFGDGKIEIDFSVSIQSERFPQNIELGVYRILQETISNIHKHAKCKTVAIHLIENQNQLILLVEDDGVGFDEKTLLATGAGLDNIRFRVESLQGKIVLETQPNRGCVYRIYIPLPTRRSV